MFWPLKRERILAAVAKPMRKVHCHTRHFVKDSTYEVERAFVVLLSCFVCIPNSIINAIPPGAPYEYVFFFFFAFRPSPGWAESVSLARITTGCVPQGKDSRGRAFFPGWCPSRTSDTALSRQSVIPLRHDTFSYLHKDPICHPGSRNDQEVNKNAIDCEITVPFSPVNSDEIKLRDISLQWKKNIYIDLKKGIFKTRRVYSTSWRLAVVR